MAQSPILRSLIALLAVAACGDNSSSTSIAKECNPLGGPGCMLPWPSSVYLVDDATTETGYRVELPAEGMPVNADGIAIDPTVFNEYDGFPVAGTMIADFPNGVSADGLPPHTDVAASMEPDASVVVVNMSTGERLPIFAEPDMNANAPEERALLIRPLKRMDSATRYAVGISTKVKAADGSALALHPGFERILAGKVPNHPNGEKIADYEAIFEALDGAGMPKSELALAWDFVTASDEFLTSDLLRMRAGALEAMGEKAANLSVDLSEESIDNPDELLAFLTGTFEVPTYLTDGESNTSLIKRDSAGAPTLNGMGEANIAALIPRCAETAELPLPVVIFGHGMFGNAKGSLDSDLLQSLAQNQCAIVLGSDFIGLTNRQFASVAFAMNDLNRGRGLSEKMAQAIINHIAMQKLLHGPLLSHERFMRGDEAMIDTTRVQYFGGSLGGILGAVYMAYDPDITRGALGVPGGPWNLLYERSVFWPPLRITMVGAYPRPWDYELNVALMGMLFEKVDPVTTAHRLISDPLPDTPPKQMLLYMALGDALVSNIASDMLARSMDLPVTSPSVDLPYGLVETTEPASSGYTIYDEGVSPWPPESNALEDLEYNSTHQNVHDRKSVERQVFQFLFEGIVTNPCSLEGAPAPCQCDLGACQ